MEDTFAVAIFSFAGIDTAALFIVECDLFAVANDHYGKQARLQSETIEMALR